MPNSSQAPTRSRRSAGTRRAHAEEGGGDDRAGGERRLLVGAPGLVDRQPHVPRRADCPADAVHQYQRRAPRPAHDAGGVAGGFGGFDGHERTAPGPQWAAAITGWRRAIPVRRLRCSRGHHRAPPDDGPAPDVLPDVLPTERLGVTGKAVPRDPRRAAPHPRRPQRRRRRQRLPPVRRADRPRRLDRQPRGCTWRCSCGWAAPTPPSPPSPTRPPTGSCSRTSRVNDWVGRWVVGYPAFISTDLYRRGHMAHHKEEFGPHEPDMNLYVGYPVSRASLRRKLTRDALGKSGWKNLRSLLRRRPDEGVRPARPAHPVLPGRLLVRRHRLRPARGCTCCGSCRG